MATSSRGLTLDFGCGACCGWAQKKSVQSRFAPPDFNTLPNRRDRPPLTSQNQPYRSHYPITIPNAASSLSFLALPGVRRTRITRPYALAVTTTSFATSTPLANHPHYHRHFLPSTSTKRPTPYQPPPPKNPRSNRNHVSHKFAVLPREVPRG